MKICLEIWGLPNPFDTFESFFSGRRPQQPQEKGRDLSLTIGIELEDIFFGKEKTIKYNRQVACKTCKGSGGVWQKCTLCDGMGIKRVVTGNSFFRNIHTITCERCSGRGRLPLNLCSGCSGKGTITKEEKFSFKVPCDIRPGQRIHYPNFGDEKHNAITGALFVGIELKAHQKFELIGDDLVYIATITPIELIIGAIITVPYFEKDLELKIPELGDVNQKYIFRGKGMKKVYEYNGNLIIKLILKSPDNLTKKQKETLSEINSEDNFKIS